VSEPQVVNILKSNAIVRYAPLGETLPDVDLAAGADWGGNWTRIGFTKAPLTVSYTADEVEIEVEEFLAPIDRMKIKHGAMFSTVLSEFDFDYMQLGVDGSVSEQSAGPGQVGYQEIQLLDDFHVVKRVWGLEGLMYDENDNALPVRVYFTRATSRIGGEMEFSKRTDDYTGMPMEIKALADPDYAGRLMIWRRITALATS